MKRFLWMAACLLGVGAANAAQTVTVDRLNGTYYRPAWAGEYQLTVEGVTGVVDGSFQSFCIQMDALVGSNSNSYDVTVSDTVMDSGVSLTPEVAYLYTEFRNGTLEGYDYEPGSGRESSSRALQAAIWYLMGEGDDLDELINPTGSGWDEATDEEVALANQFIEAALNSEWTTIGSVRVLNLTTCSADGTIDNQDMLVMVVPVPGALVLGSLGLGIVGWLRRRTIA